MTTQVVIDPNVRVRGQLTFAGFEDVRGPLAVGMTVDVVEPESGLIGQGRVVEIDPGSSLVYLGVDWRSLRPGEEQGARSASIDRRPPDLWIITSGGVYSVLRFEDHPMVSTELSDAAFSVSVPGA